MKADSPLLLKKPVQALVMVPKVGKLTTVARKLYNVILRESQLQIAELTKQGAVDLGGHMYSARLCDLLDPIQVGSSNLRALAKTYFREMMQTTIEWEAPDSKSKGVVWDISHLLSAARLEYLDADGSPGTNNNAYLVARWGLPAPLYNALRNPELYAQVSIAQLAKLTTYEGVALYEICTRYRTNFDGLTNKAEPEWWVRALTNKVPGIDPETGLPKYRPWSKFKEEKIKAALAEISEVTDLEVQLVEEKAGKKISAVQFRVRRKTGDLLEDAIRLTADVAEHGSRLGLSLADLTALVRRGLSESLLKVGLLKLESRLARSDLAPVTSRFAYLNSVIAEAEKFVDAKPAAPAAPVERTPPATQQLPLIQVPTFKEERRAALRQEFMKLTKDKQQPYTVTAAESLKAAGMFHPSIARAIYSGDWLKNGLLLSKMVDAYAVDRYGADWHIEPAARE